MDDALHPDRAALAVGGLLPLHPLARAGAGVITPLFAQGRDMGTGTGLGTTKLLALGFRLARREAATLPRIGAGATLATVGALARRFAIATP